MSEVSLAFLYGLAVGIIFATGCCLFGAIWDDWCNAMEKVKK